MKTILSLAAAAIVCLAPASSMAQQKQDAADATAKPVIDNPYLPKIEKQTEALGKKLDESALKHLYYVREGYGATRAVALVRRDIDAAVKACGKANPDMKDALNAEFAEWVGAVDPIIKENDTMIDRTIAEQDYAPAKEIKDYLKLIGQAGEHANKLVDKQIITTPESCSGLEKSMDRTREKVSELLSSVKLLVWPLPESERPPATAPATTKND